MKRLILIGLLLLSSGCASTTVIVEQRPGHHTPTVRAEIRLR